MRFWLGMAVAALPVAVLAQELPVTKAGLISALGQYFAGADRNGDGKLDRAETAQAMGYARSLLTEQRDPEPFVMDTAPDGSPRLALNDKGPLSQAGMIDLAYQLTDRDGDGLLSVSEVKAVGGAAFDAADRDGDGILDDAERQAAMAKLRLFRGVLSGGK